MMIAASSGVAVRRLVASRTARRVAGAISKGSRVLCQRCSLLQSFHFSLIRHTQVFIFESYNYGMPPSPTSPTPSTATGLDSWKSSAEFELMLST